MNERNVEALKQLLGVAVLANRDREGELSFEFLSKWLSARGVLVPSALTNEDSWKVGATLGTYTDYPILEATKMRAELERIAKGDA